MLVWPVTVTLETCIFCLSPLTFKPLPSGVPSAPRNLVSVINETSVLLEWHSPRDTGHRGDVSYNVLCRRCHGSERRACQPCDDSVVFVPGKRGLQETRVEISKLRAHMSYTFDIQVCPVVREESSYVMLLSVATHNQKPYTKHFMQHNCLLLIWNFLVYSQHTQHSII